MQPMGQGTNGNRKIPLIFGTEVGWNGQSISPQNDFIFLKGRTKQKQTNISKETVQAKTNKQPKAIKEKGRELFFTLDQL